MTPAIGACSCQFQAAQLVATMAIAMLTQRKRNTRCTQQRRCGLNQGLQPSWIGQREPGRSTFGPERHKSAVPKAGKMLTHRGLRQVHVIDQIPHPVFAAN